MESAPIFLAGLLREDYGRCHFRFINRWQVRATIDAASKARLSRAGSPGSIMLGDIARFLLNIVFTLFGAVLLLRVWLQMVRMPPYNSVSRTVFKITDWLVVPLRRVIRGAGGIDWACIVAAWLCALVYMLAIMLVSGLNPVSLLPEGLFIALVLVLKWAVSLVMWVTLLMAIMSWVNPTAPAMPVLVALTDPLLNPIRRIMPSLGGIDLSPLVLFVLTQIALMVLARLGLPMLGI